MITTQATTRLTIAALLGLGFVGCGGPAGDAIGDAGTPLTETSASSASATLLDRTFDDIKFDIEPDAPYDRSMLTEEIEALNGKRIRIRGYILPTAQKRGIEQFVLVRDNRECCFGPGAALYDCVLVEMETGKSAEFSIRPVAVEGKFSLQEFIGPEGRPLAIYHLSGESVR